MEGRGAKIAIDGYIAFHDSQAVQSVSERTKTGSVYIYICNRYIISTEFKRQTPRTASARESKRRTEDTPC